MVTKRVIDVDTADRADGKVPAWDTASGTHIYVPAGAVADITDIPTAETDTTKRLAPDGAGGVEWGTGGGSGVATDAIWTTAGKVAVATGTATATEQYPPGYEFNYVEVTSTVNITGTSEGAANTAVTSGSVTFDGSTIVFVEFFCPRVSTSTATSSSIVILLYEDSTLLGRLALVKTVGGESQLAPVMLKRRVTPSAAGHTYTIKGYSTSGTTGSAFVCGNGGTGVELPMYIRVVKA